jgi:hypothetical protein
MYLACVVQQVMLSVYVWKRHTTAYDAVDDAVVDTVR